jgi:hypothetical protein
MAFGGLKGIRTLWGVPGGNYDDYANPNAITLDIPHCTRGHNGGFFAEPFINSSQLLHYDVPSVLHSILFPHWRASLRASLDGVIDALLFAQHVLEMFRRALPEGPSRTSLSRLSNRLTKIIAHARQLTPP